MDEYGYAPENAFSALGYDTLRLLAEAIDRSGSSDPEAILLSLGNTSGFKGVTGNISYQSGRRILNKDVTMISLIDGRNHRFGDREIRCLLPGRRCTMRIGILDPGLILFANIKKYKPDIQ